MVIGELYQGAYCSLARERHLTNIEKRILPAVTVLPYDTATAKVFGEIRARLEVAGTILPDADLQIAATALIHRLELVTGNLRHFDRIAGLKLNPILSDSPIINLDINTVVGQRLDSLDTQYTKKTSRKSKKTFYPYRKLKVFHAGEKYLNKSE